MPRPITAEESEILRTIEIPPRPEVLLRIAVESDSEQPNITKVASLIKQDMAISGAVLQIINSAAYRRPTDITSIEQAVMLLGLDHIFPLVKAVALRATMSREDDLTSFWQQQADIANACVLAARSLGEPDLADQAYMLGLFHFSGVPVLHQVFDDYAEFMRRADREGWENLADDERNHYKTSHSTVGALFAHKWALPRYMSHVIYNMHDVDDIYETNNLSKTALDYLTILKMARTVVICKDGNLHEYAEWTNVSSQILAYYEIDGTDMNQRLLDVREKLSLVEVEEMSQV